MLIFCSFSVVSNLSLLDHFARCIENTQLAPAFLGKEPNEMHCWARFNVAKDHRFRQLPSA